MVIKKQLGFTGTKAGMTGNQASTVLLLLDLFRPDIVRHGNCMGSDEQFHQLVRMFYAAVQIHVHLATSKYQASCLGDFHYDPKPPLDRNHDIVDPCAVVIATPAQVREVLRSGTWAAIRRARERAIPVYIIGPDGRHFIED